MQMTERLECAERWPLDQPLCMFTELDAWTIRSAFEGIFGFGRSGSGKSSATAKTIAKALLDHGFGILVLTAKIGEREDWENYAAAAGRADDVLVFRPGNGLKFNFLDYEYRRPGAGSGLTENLGNLLMTVMEASGRSGGGGSQGVGQGEAYWTQALRQLLSNAIDLVAIAKDRVSLGDIYKVVNSAPQYPEQSVEEAWQESSFCYQSLMQGDTREDAGVLDPIRLQDWHMTATYFLEEFPALSDRTRSIIVNMFTGMANSFLRGELYDLFCTETNCIPELMFGQEGGDDGTGAAVLIIDLPVKEYRQIGVYAQVLWKYMTQLAAERRDLREYPTPLAIFADECHFFITSYDFEFQSTARSAGVATVNLTQNYDNLIAMLGGESARAQVESLLGNFATLVFHTNAHTKTNEWAAETIGKVLQMRTNVNFNSGEQGGMSHGGGGSQVMEYELPPQAYTQLRTGGEVNDLHVDAIVFRSGAPFSNGRNWIAVTYQQS